QGRVARHAGVRDRSDHRATRDHRAELSDVRAAQPGELPLAGRQGGAAIVTAPSSGRARTHVRQLERGHSCPFIFVVSMSIRGPSSSAAMCEGPVPKGTAFGSRDASWRCYFVGFGNSILTVLPPPPPPPWPKVPVK